jgi:hypothetical protein
MVDVQTFSIATASAGVLIAAIYYVLQVRHQRRMRQTDLVMRLHSDFNKKELQEGYFALRTLDFVDYSDFMKKYRMPSKSVVQLWQVGKFFDSVSVLLRRKLVDIGLVDDLFHTEALLAWEKLKPIAEGRRKELKQPTVYQWFEYLYNELRKRERSRR